MKIFTIIGFSAVAAAGCASTKSPRSEPATSVAATTNQQRAHADGGEGGMMADMCPMQVPGTTVTATDIEGGVGLAFTTKSGSVEEVRQRVQQMAETHNNKHSGGMMAEHGAPASASDDDHQHGAGHGSHGQDGMMMGDKMMPPATALVEDIEGGARLNLRPNDPAQLAALQEHVRMKAQQMTSGECAMMSSSSNPSDIDHEGHHAVD